MEKKRQTQFTILLAGIVIGITSNHLEVKKLCKEYLTDEPPEIRISISKEDIEFERKKSAREDEIEGRNIRNFTDAYLETLAVYRKIAENLLEYNIMLFHGSAISVDGNVYLFTAKSGTGKSTHTRLWREYFGERAVMINDDKPLLKIEDEKIIVYGTPWDGKHRLSNNISMSLKGICILTRDKRNTITQMDRKTAYPMLVQQSYRPKDTFKLTKTLDLIDKLSTNVKIYHLGCNMEPEAAIVAYNGMQKQEESI